MGTMTTYKVFGVDLESEFILFEILFPTRDVSKDGTQGQAGNNTASKQARGWQVVAAAAVMAVVVGSDCHRSSSSQLRAA